MAGRAETRYFVAPSAAHAAPWLDALARAGVAARRVDLDSAGDYALYELTPR